MLRKKIYKNSPMLEINWSINGDKNKFACQAKGEKRRKKNLPGGELNPGLPRDRRGYWPLYYRGPEDVVGHIIYIDLTYVHFTFITFQYILDLVTYIISWWLNQFGKSAVFCQHKASKYGDLVSPSTETAGTVCPATDNLVTELLLSLYVHTVNIKCNKHPQCWTKAKLAPSVYGDRGTVELVTTEQTEKPPHQSLWGRRLHYIYAFKMDSLQACTI